MALPGSGWDDGPYWKHGQRAKLVRVIDGVAGEFEGVDGIWLLGGSVLIQVPDEKPEPKFEHGKAYVTRAGTIVIAVGMTALDDDCFYAIPLNSDMSINYWKSWDKSAFRPCEIEVKVKEES